MARIYKRGKVWYLDTDMRKAELEYLEWTDIDFDSRKIRTKLREKMIQIAKQAVIESLTNLHTLRHTFASHLVMQGVYLPTVMKLMGHTDIQTTMIYAHLAPDHLADVVDKLSFS